VDVAGEFAALVRVLLADTAGEFFALRALLERAGESLVLMTESSPSSTDGCLLVGRGRGEDETR
jgi:hypothetical protein